jgi:hypothetical protein
LNFCGDHLLGVCLHSKMDIEPQEPGQSKHLELT